LQFGEKKIASTVCWSWYEASIHPMFLNNEVICLKDMDNQEIQEALKVYTKSLRAFFTFKICGLGISFQNNDEDDPEILINENHWVKTVWPLLATKVFFLEFFDTVEFIDDILPALLNETQHLKALKIHNLQYSPKEELHKVKRLQLLEELTLDNLQTDNIDNDKLFGIIPKQLRKICLKSMWCSKFIIDDINKVLNYCSFYLETLELINIDVTPELMRSIASLGMKLKRFCLVIADSMYYDHEPQIIWPLFKTQWPLIDLTLRADCLTNEHLYIITNTFKNLEKLSVSSDSATCNVTKDGIDSFVTLKKLKTLYVGFGREYSAYGAFY
jgi:hypothetical protein